MTISIFGKVPEDSGDRELIKLLFDELLAIYDKIFVWQTFWASIKDFVDVNSKIKTFSNKDELRNSSNLLISLGGDGTMLDTVDFVIGTEIAVLGVNLGHLGFLTTAGREDMQNLAKEIAENNFTIEKRPILGIDYNELASQRHFAVNEACFLSTNRGSIIDLEVFIDGKYLSTYSGDGIIIATPTGSTAYSMSAGGPIVSPESSCLCLTPIAPHNLTFRPIIIADNAKIRVHIPQTDNACKMLVDGYSIFEKSHGDILIEKSVYQWNLVRLENQDFFKAIRDKLMWGTTPKYLSGNL
ncbi:MAG: NAD(+)/NADH kinase [Bacteroidales bacterium]|nr:NAD(+)/NADH kinase [Bacteroidales bacterium]